ncbi:hypothetical protein [Streptomyces sp. BE133]|uniref:hypothetical protein n=1 Tax=Streptomyces sp. BE133 TaxID=3002523 RepID=UPI002E7A1D0F|nr:hypothetical protein [Streptomyces sp. BE133]MEE1809451.1 hypothetical protein [Streptomyces sp. BE133]
MLLAAFLPSAVIATWNLSSGDPAGDTPALLANLAMLALLAGTALARPLPSRRPAPTDRRGPRPGCDRPGHQ